VIQWLIKTFKRIFGIRQEFCLVVEQFDDHLEAVYARVNNHKKKIKLVKRRKIKNFDKLRKPLAFIDRLVVALDSRHATTLESVVRLKRSKPQEIINEGELDHLVFRGLWEFLNRYRSWVGKKMGISDLDLVLADVQIREVNLGSHKVFNPTGFKGREVLFRFRATFVPRSMADLVSKFRSWASDLLVVENHSIVSLSIPEPTDFVVHLAETRTCVFASRPEERLYCKECLWGAKNIPRAIANTFSVDEDVAQAIVGRYLENGVSPKVARIVDALIRSEFRILLDMLNSIYNKRENFLVRPAIHFNFKSFVPRPEYLFSNNRLKSVDFANWALREGYSFVGSGKKYFSSPLHQGTVALLQHSYTDAHYDFVNRLLKRRVRWLVS